MTTHSIERLTRASAYRIIGWQVIVMFIVTSVALVLGGIKAALSALYGSLICVLTNLYFAWYLFRIVSPRAAARIVGTFYFGESVKFITTILLFFVVIKYFDAQLLPLIGAYIVVQSVLWFAMFFNKNVTKGTRS